MDNPQTVLIADDNPEIREVLSVLLESEGYRVLQAKDGNEAVAQAAPEVDLFLLDVMMPGLNGFAACSEIRRRSSAPILFLTAKTQDTDKEEGFASGGDDYLAKPFSSVELLSRVRALLRRYYVYRGKETPQPQEPTLLRIDDITINLHSQEVFKGPGEVNLTDIEFRLLLLLAQNRKKVFTAQELYESVWKEPYLYTSNNTVMVHIRNLRKKLENDPQSPKIIKNIWGKGYRIE